MGCLCSKPSVEDSSKSLDENQIEVELVISNPEEWSLEHVNGNLLDKTGISEKDKAKDDITANHEHTRSPMSVVTPLLNCGVDSGTCGNKTVPRVFTFFDQLSPTTLMPVSN